MKHRLYLNDNLVPLTGLYQTEDYIREYLLNEGEDIDMINELFANGEVAAGYSLISW